jgi:hypothetical protein
MQVDLSTGSAEDLVQEADRKWHQPWNYNGFLSTSKMWMTLPPLSGKTEGPLFCNI